VRGSENPADLCTKHLTRAVIDELIKICGIIREAGRATSAPELNVEAEPLPTKQQSGSTLLASFGLQCFADSRVLTPTTGQLPTLPRSTHGPSRTLTYDETNPTIPPPTTGQPATASRPHTTPPRFRPTFSCA
jgi:hypothetical protein